MGAYTTFTRGEQYGILAAIGVDGYISTCIVIGSVDSHKFFDFIISKVVSIFLPLQSAPLFTCPQLQLPKINPYLQPQSVLVLDNCNIHKSKILQEIVGAYG